MSEPELATRAGNGTEPPPGSWLPDEPERGVTSIAQDVVARIAALAAHEVEGVARLGGEVPEAMAATVGRIAARTGPEGVGVEVGTRQVACDLAVTVRYPSPIRQVTEAVRENVIDRIEAMTGLEVVEVNIAVIDLAFDGGPQGARVV